VQQTKVDRNGRVLLPAAIRRALGLRTGSQLSVNLEPRGDVVLRTPANAWQRARHLVAESGQTDSVVNEVLRDRRADFAREAAESDDGPPECPPRS
jgi:AbrB family looped-hinge helix DNA binding protein